MAKKSKNVNFNVSELGSWIKFNKGEDVTTYIEKRSQICIVISGEIDLIRYDFNGNQTIIEKFNKLHNTPF